MTGTCEHLMTTQLLIRIRKTTQYGLIPLLCLILIYLSNWSSVVKEFGLLDREWVIAEFRFLLSSYPQQHKCVEINLLKAFWSHLLPFLLRCPFVILCLNNFYQVCIFGVKKNGWIWNFLHQVIRIVNLTIYLWASSSFGEGGEAPKLAIINNVCFPSHYIL